MQDKNNVVCPRCNCEIDVNAVVYSQLEAQFKSELEKLSAKKDAEIQKAASLLEKEKEQLKTRQEALEELINHKAKEEVNRQKKDIEEKARLASLRDREEEMKLMKEQLLAKSEEVKNFYKTKAELETLKRDMDEQTEKLKLQYAEESNRLITLEKERIRKEEEQKNQLKALEQDQMIKNMTKQIQDMQRQMELGSSQRQGEAQEMAIEEWLMSSYPVDVIEEIKKGARGADCIQRVFSKIGQECGTIYYESKRTKDFQPAWIEKFKTDMRAKNAGVGVLVTEVLPKDMSSMGQRSGVWICTFEEFKNLSLVLRETVIKMCEANNVQANRGEKTAMIYDYVTSNEFKMQVEAIIEGFNEMKEDLDKERRSFESLWKKREKQIQKVLLNTTHIYSSIKGLAGSALGTIKSLELPEPE